MSQPTFWDRVRYNVATIAATAPPEFGVDKDDALQLVDKTEAFVEGWLDKVDAAIAIWSLRRQLRRGGTADDKAAQDKPATPKTDKPFTTKNPDHKHLSPDVSSFVQDVQRMFPGASFSFFGDAESLKKALDEEFKKDEDGDGE